MIIMYVTATEFRTNVGKYLELMQKEDIYIMKYGKPHGMLTASEEIKQKLIDSLSGSLEYDGNPEDLLEKRLEDI